MMKNEDVVSDGLLTISRSADFINLSRAKLYQLMDAGELQFVKIGRSRRIPKRALIQLAADNLRGGTRKD